MVLMLMFVTSKSQTNGHETIFGTFYYLKIDKHFSSSYTLELRHDSTFTFYMMVKDAKPQCDGRWKIINNEFIILECCEVSNPIEVLSSGYMNQRIHKLKIINKNKLKYSNVVLKRKN